MNSEHPGRSLDGVARAGRPQGVWYLGPQVPDPLGPACTGHPVQASSWVFAVHLFWRNLIKCQLWDTFNLSMLEMLG